MPDRLYTLTNVKGGETNETYNHQILKKKVEDWREAYPIIHQLRTHLTEAMYMDLVAEAVNVDRYLLYALYEAEEIAAVVGFKEMTTLNNGRFIWVCDLITDKEKRSLGYGEKLLSFVHEYAREKKD